MVRLSSGSHWLARDLRKSVEMNLRKPQESGLAYKQGFGSQLQLGLVDEHFWRTLI